MSIPYKRLLTPKVLTYLVGTNRLIYHKDTSLDTKLIAEKLELSKIRDWNYMMPMHQMQQHR
jgi:hypothetical protein